MKYSRSDYRFAGAVCLLGLFVVLVGLDLIPAEPESFHAPHWIVALCGMLFFLAGASVLSAGYPRLRLSIVALLLAMFAMLSGWMAFLAAPEGWGGGISFLSGDINAWLARMLAGCGFILLIYAFIQVVGRLIGGGFGRRSPEKDGDESSPHDASGQ